jgi:hypothetical protein
MELRVIGPQQVIELLPMSECIDVVDGAMRSASGGQAVMPLRDKMALPGGGLLGWMPGYMASPDVFGVKLVRDPTRPPLRGRRRLRDHRDPDGRGKRAGDAAPGP